MIFPQKTIKNTQDSVSLSITACTLIAIDYFSNLLIKIMDIPNIQITLATMFVGLSLNSKHLRGTTYRQSKTLVDYRIAIASKIIFVMLFYSFIRPLIRDDNQYNIIDSLFLLYLPYYVDFAEYRGDRRIVMPSRFHEITYKIFQIIGSYHIINDGSPLDNNNDKRYILGLHPHGLFPFGSIGCLTQPHDMETIRQTMPILLSRRLNSGIASFALYMPFIREIFLWLGAIDCSRPILKRRLRDGHSIAVFIGGAQEAQYSGRGSVTLIINKRNGIFRLALETGAKLVPVYTFGDNNTYRSYSWDLFGILNLFKVITGIWFPRGYFEFRRHRFVTIVGKPIEINDIINLKDQDPYENITDDMVAVLKTRYIESLTELFDRYKYLDADIKDKSLIIV